MKRFDTLDMMNAFVFGGLAVAILMTFVQTMWIDRQVPKLDAAVNELYRLREENKNLHSIISVEHTQTFRDVDLLLPFPDNRETLLK